MSQAPASLSTETGGTDDYIQKIHLSSKLPTRNLHSRISKAEREAFKTKHAFWVDISRIQGTPKIVSPVQSLQIFSGKLLESGGSAL